ncbi:ferritin-like domain-containing protein [Azonexus sp. IMCC34842]|uniref:ferritin-like domain-containing protein n=1 Tax=Azonexus sp. IMCC34842 TaxID=3420950 RepID=UPI003D132AEF
MTSRLFPALAEALACCAIEQKLALTAALEADWQAGKLDHLDDAPVTLSVGRPAQPELVPHTQLRQRSPQTVEGRASLLHAIVHIEFTAINLALDHAARFRGLPARYYTDWIGVAAEEAHHFTILRERLRALGHEYGDFPAHGGLSAMAERTGHDVLARMALVPRLLEARGLDATPPIQKKLEACGDTTSARVLDIILHDEIGHVGLGDTWFRHLCGERGLEPESTYRQLIAEYQAPWPQAPLNRQARLAAGFSSDELTALLAGRQPGEQRGI